MNWTSPLVFKGLICWFYFNPFTEISRAHVHENNPTLLYILGIRLAASLALPSIYIMVNDYALSLQAIDRTSDPMMDPAYEQRHDKINKMSVYSAKSQISLGIRPV